MILTRIVDYPDVVPFTLTAEARCSNIRTVTSQGGAFHELTVDIELAAGMWTGAVRNEVDLSAGVVNNGTAMVTPRRLIIAGPITFTNETTNTGFVYTGSGCEVNPQTGVVDPPSEAEFLFPASPLLCELAAGPNATSGDILASFTEGYL